MEGPNPLQRPFMRVPGFMAPLSLWAPQHFSQPPFGPEPDSVRVGLELSVRGLVRVGPQGLGPAVDERLVVIAAYCLPFFPPSHPANFPRERMYKDFLEALGAGQAKV